MQQNRKINGVAKPHKAYDYGAVAGTKVYLPRTTKYAVCVDTYIDKDNGSGAAFACYDISGKLMGYVRYFHLDPNSIPQRGMTYDGQVFGIGTHVATVGKKDKLSTGEHLDVIYFDAKGNVVTDDKAIEAFGISKENSDIKAKLKK